MLSFILSSLIGCSVCVDCADNAESGCPDCDSGSAASTATLTVTTSFDGMDVASDVHVYDAVVNFDIEEDEEIVVAPTGKAIEIPADEPLGVVVGNSDSTDCDGRPLHADETGNLWTYDTLEVTASKGETVSKEIPFGQYLLGWFACSNNSYWYNEESGEYDVFSRSDSYDPLLVKMEGTRILTTGAANAIAEIGGGTFRVLGSEIVFVANDGDNVYIEDGSSRVTRDEFSFTFIRSGGYRYDVNCMLTTEATCASE